MNLPRISIFNLMVIIVVIALDGSLLRQMDFGEDNSEILGAASIFSMTNILAVGLLRILSTRGKNRPFLIGFEVAGTLAILAYLGCFRLFPGRMEDLWMAARSPIEAFCESHAPRWIYDCFYQETWDDYPTHLKFPMLLVVLPWMTIPFLASQLCIALIGGRMAQVLSSRNNKTFDGFQGGGPIRRESSD